MYELLKKLKIIDSTVIRGFGVWSTLMKIVETIEKDKTEVIEIEDHRDDYHQKYCPLAKEALKDMETWSTYEGGVDIEIKYYDKNKIIAIIEIWDCNTFSGYRENIRFIVTLRMDISFLKEIKENINSTFRDYLEEAYEVHLENEKEKWILEKKASLLKGEEK
jgi:hypothetical protein